MLAFVFALVAGIRDLLHRLRRFFRRSPPTTLTDLPTEILQVILTDVGESSFGDLCRAKKSCRTLRHVADDAIFLRGIDLWVMSTPNRYLTGIQIFKLRCLAVDNPSAIFLTGIHDFFRRGNLAGLPAIRRAAEAGYDLAVYSYANIVRILQPNGHPQGALLNPSKEAVRAAKAKVESADLQAWTYQLPPLFVEMLEFIEIDEMYRCRCARNRSWPRPWDERVKRGEMCNSCFWTIHTLWFAREFKKRVLEWPQ